MSVLVKGMEKPEHCGYCRFRYDGICHALQKTQYSMNECPLAQPEQRWIPCSERLPEKGNEVLVCYDYKGHRSVFTGALYDDGKFYGYDDEYLTPEGRKYRKAVAWMPLPEPYKGGEQNGKQF